MVPGAPADKHESADDTVLLRGGDVYDPANRRSGERMDVLIQHGVVTDIGPELSAERTKVIDCRGQLVIPGLVDVHTHIYEGVCKVGLDPVEAHYRRGVVAAADGGSVGASTFHGYRKFIADPSPMRILAFLNVSVLGLIDQRFGELLRPEAFSRPDIEEVLANGRDIIRGLKIRLSQDIVHPDDMLLTLEKAVATGQDLGLPVMAHIGHTQQEIRDIVERMGPGDIVTHCYTAKGHGILTDGEIDKAVLAARDRGVVFDVGHGTTQMTYRVARTAMAQGFPPDTIGSDLSANNWRSPAFDLATVMSKLVALGMPLIDAVAATSLRPAEILGIREEGYGALTVGASAYVTVLQPQNEPLHLPDADGAELAVSRLEPTLVINRTTVQETSPWRGAAEARAR